MKSILVFYMFSALAVAKPQMPTPPTAPPPLSSPTEPAPVPPTEEPVPVPEPSPPGHPPDEPTKDPNQPSPPNPGKGPICQCGYTYCASILMGMKVPWPEERLAEGYCNTPNAACQDGVPPVDVTEALFICLCGAEDDEVGDKLDVLCGCDSCLVVGPDYRGRCERPCAQAPPPPHVTSGGPD
ncbi:hypothetical protein N3K66_007124 [Trichothecium roseum]|uniref:Uncharacterized protein n=1 Tax=Trichothecium roseum TaxID=47278 RepID=A0ACC0UXS4_9HYPO|nr:hypothetical protein N3K66_007124 [Trichothecium roseum]